MIIMVITVITIITFFFFTSIIFHLLVIFLAERFIPYLGFFPYKETLNSYNLPSWLSKLASFDGLHYLSIAQKGYSQYEQAFFPFYPLLIKFLTFFTKNPLLSGLLISNISFFFGLVFFLKYLKIIDEKIDEKIFLLLFLTFPTSFFFNVVYTEGLFFLLFSLSLYFLKKENYPLFMITSALTSLTRLIGIFLVIHLFFHFFKKKEKKLIYFFLIFSPLIGFFLYSFYLFKTTGDPLFFFSAQPAFGANRSTNLIFFPQVAFRYLKIFFTASLNFQFYLALFEFVIFFLIFFVLIFDFFKQLNIQKNFKIKIKNFDLLSINIFSFVNLLLPSLTGTFSSIPRYALFSLSFFLYLAKIKSVFWRYFFLVSFTLFHLVLFGFFIQGYFVS